MREAMSSTKWQGQDAAEESIWKREERIRHMKIFGKHICKSIIALISIWTCIMALTGCQKKDLAEEREQQTKTMDKAGAEEGTAEPDESENAQMPGSGGVGTGDQESSDAVQGQNETEADNAAADSSGEASVSEGSEALADMPQTAPKLPQTGQELADFVPEGWELHDSIELDFNGDGVPDYVGVLELAMVDMGDYGMYQEGPRILFAIAGDETGGYSLDFQDSNLIRTRDEGGVFGDPYLPLTAEGNSFTTHTFGGSAWKWSEDFTYTYRDGVWYLAMSESTYGYGPYITSYEKDDWERGVGIRKKRSDEFSDMEESWDLEEAGENPVYDIEYELKLDEPPTLYQAGMRWWLAPDRVTDWTVESIDFAADVTLSEDRVKRPDQVYLGDYCDENCVLYPFSDEDSGFYYLARYRFRDRALSLLARETSAIDGMKIYKGKIYYTTEIVEDISYRTVQDGQEQVVEKADTVGIRLNRMNADGTGKETVFEYRYPGASQEIMDGWPPYLALMYEISGGEIVAEVYVGSEPHPVYRMKADGSGAKLIGQIPAG